MGRCEFTDHSKNDMFEPCSNMVCLKHLFLNMACSYVLGEHFGGVNFLKSVSYSEFFVPRMVLSGLLVHGDE